MTKREKYIGSVLFVMVLIWAVSAVSQQPKAKKSAAPSAVFSIPAAPGAVQGNANTGSADVEALIEQMNLKSKEPKVDAVLNPFKKLDQKVVSEKTTLELSDLVLSGIVNQNNISMALINDQLLQEGEQIAGFLIKEIRPNEVILVRGLEKHILKLFEETSK